MDQGMIKTNENRETDELLTTITDYVVETKITSEEAYHTASLVLLDTIGCGILALNFPECTKMLGPIVPETTVAHGARVPGTNYILDPVRAAFNIGCMNRWLDYNDTWLAQEWGHPSDNLGALLAVGDYLSRVNLAKGRQPLTIKALLAALIKAHEIQGVIALNNSFNRVGLDHVLLVKIASTAVVTHLLGGDRQTIINALSNAWIDNASLRTYRHAPNTGSRKSWAAGDATSRAVFLALIALKGEMGYPTALSASSWGFHDVLFGGNQVTLTRDLESYVMENILFKVQFPAEFHGQTAAECGVILHPEVKDRLREIERIVIHTHESAIRIIDKTGPLLNPADRDHCLQYILAVALYKGDITSDDYEDEMANNPVIDELRSKMEVIEDKEYSKDYLDETKRSIANAVEVYFKDGSKTKKIAIEYPLGHRMRRQEAEPFLLRKFNHNLLSHFTALETEEIEAQVLDFKKLQALNINEFMDLFVKP